MLGAVQAVSEAWPLPVGGLKQRALLAELLLHRGSVVPRDRLVDALWGEHPPDSAHASLQVYVHGLRRALGSDRIATIGTGYRVNLEPGELDVERFEQLLDRADRALARETLRRRSRLSTGRSRSGVGRRSPTCVTSRSR